MNVYILRLQKYDDLTTILDKMAWCHAPRLILVFPERKKIVASRVEFSLIKRAAQKRGIIAAAVIKNGDLRFEAEKGGLIGFNSIEQARRTRWEKSIKMSNPPFLAKPARFQLREIKYYFSFKKKTIQNNKYIFELLFSVLVIGITILMYIHFYLTIKSN